MKKSSRIFGIILAVLVIFSAFTFTGYAEERLNYLVIGDSIARGAGILNPDEACYGLIVADTNGYNYKNNGIDGLTSDGLIRQLQIEDYANDVKNADIISISIGGNDYLKSGILKLFIGKEIKNDISVFEEIQKEFSENLDVIIKTIREYNPHAVILMQTIYNMRSDLLKGTNQVGTDLLNEVYRSYSEKNPQAYILVDTGGALMGRSECLSSDTIHPNGLGNIEMARVILKELYALGLGTETEPVINVEPLENSGFGFEYWCRVIKYYFNYLKKHFF